MKHVFILNLILLMLIGAQIIAKWYRRKEQIIFTNAELKTLKWFSGEHMRVLTNLKFPNDCVASHNLALSLLLDITSIRRKMLMINGEIND